MRADRAIWIATANETDAIPPSILDRFLVLQIPDLRPGERRSVIRGMIEACLAGLGGVDTADLQARTLESRNVPGLFFIGEVVDVTGHLGGFNFQWAWASAVAAARAV